MPLMPTAASEHPIVQSDLERIASASLPWDRLAGRTIMITGGGGFLAAYLIKALLHAGDYHALGLRVIAVARSAGRLLPRLSAQIARPTLVVVEQDIAAPLAPAFPRADFLIHSASPASPRFYGSNPVGVLNANAIGTTQLLGHAVRHESERFLFMSSGEVYGVPRDPTVPITEDSYGDLDPMQLRACYAEGKRVSETMCVAWAHQHGVHATVVRPFHTYGPGLALDDGRVFADIVADVVVGRDIVLTSEGTARRDPHHDRPPWRVGELLVAAHVVAVSRVRDVAQRHVDSEQPRGNIQ
ncbi:MAG: NAD-dependent epimerase/dehydratase family protein [Gemmatimonadetes bacterium]|nr:NAD-dependent epimerase/dehydratase family protein [Gemmatimonadota bacterium]